MYHHVQEKEVQGHPRGVEGGEKEVYQQHQQLIDRLEALKKNRRVAYFEMGFSLKWPNLRAVKETRKHRERFRKLMRFSSNCTGENRTGLLVFGHIVEKHVYHVRLATRNVVLLVLGDAFLREG